MELQDQPTATTPALPGTTALPRTPPPPQTTMRAVVRRRYGPPDVLSLEQTAPPRIAPDSVLIRVHAAGLDRGAWHLMTGRPYLLRLAFGIRRSRQPALGRELAGTVVEVGPAVTGFQIGDEVFGIGAGTFADYTVARQSKLAHKPASLTFAQAAVAPISGTTALRALTDVGRLQSGQRVLIIGASGGVGSHAVQLAKSFGAEVTGVCGPTKLDLVRSLGADHVLDYTTQDFADGERRYDLILDLAGNPAPSRLRRALTPAGTAVLVGGENGGDLTGGMNRQLRALAGSLFRRQRLAMVMPDENARHLERLAELITAGQVTPVVDRTYPLEQTADAMRHLDAGNARGKVAIAVL